MYAPCTAREAAPRRSRMDRLPSFTTPFVRPLSSIQIRIPQWMQEPKPRGCGVCSVAPSKSLTNVYSACMDFEPSRSGRQRVDLENSAIAKSKGGWGWDRACWGQEERGDPAGVLVFRTEDKGRKRTWNHRRRKLDTTRRERITAPARTPSSNSGCSRYTSRPARFPGEKCRHGAFVE